MSIGDFLAILHINRFLTMNNIIYITVKDLKEIKVEKVSDHKCVFLAAAEGKALHEVI